MLDKTLLLLNVTVSQVLYVIGFRTVVDRTRYLCLNGSGLGQVIIDISGWGLLLSVKRKKCFDPHVMDTVGDHQRFHKIL